MGDILLGSREDVYSLMQNHQHQSKVTWWKWRRMHKKLRQKLRFRDNDGLEWIL